MSDWIDQFFNELKQADTDTIISTPAISKRFKMDHDTIERELVRDLRFQEEGIGRWKLKPQEEKDGRQERRKSQFIFDESKVQKIKVFSSDRTGDDLFCVGMLLPKEFERDFGYEQKESPALILSTGELEEPTKEFTQGYNIKYDSIPTLLPLRWSLSSLKSFLDKKAPMIEKNELFGQIKERYESLLFFRNPIWYDVHSLWDIGTYFHRLFNSYPIFELRGLMGTAKTKIMKVSRLMSLNSTKIWVNPSEATLFREIHDNRPTKYIDEAEKLFPYNYKTKQVEPDPRAELINASYTKGSTVPRQEKIGNKFVTVHYHTYSPTMIGSIRGLYGATESRSITHIMTKAPDSDPRGEKEPEDCEDEPIWQEIRDSLYLLLMQKWKEVEVAYREFSEQTRLKKRDLQIWKPILVFAKWISDDLFQRVKEFAEEVTKQRIDDFIPEDSLNHKILKIILELFEEDVALEKIRPKVVTKKYNDEEFDNQVREKTISGRLDSLGFKELRKRDNKGSFFAMGKNVFLEIIAPICPDLVNIHQNQHGSTLLDSELKKKSDKSVMKGDDTNKIQVMKGDDNDESDESLEVNSKSLEIQI